MKGKVHKPRLFYIDQIFPETYFCKTNILTVDATNNI